MVYNAETTSKISFENVTGILHNRHGRNEFIYSIITILNLQALTGALLNILTIISVLTFDKLKTTSNVLVLSLSTSDCLQIFGWIFSIFQEVYRDNRNTWNILCQGQVFCLVLSQGTTVYAISYIAMDRAVSIIFPIWARNHITRPVMQRIVVIHWTVFISLTLVVITFGNKIAVR